MKYAPTRLSLVLVFAVTAVTIVGDSVAGDPPAPPKLSSIARPMMWWPVKTYVETLGAATADEATFAVVARAGAPEMS